MTGAEPTGHEPAERFVEQTITYVLELEGRLLVIENVPVRVSEETGEQLFSPETVERIQQTVWEEKPPARMVETPVYEFAV